MRKFIVLIFLPFLHKNINAQYLQDSIYLFKSAILNGCIKDTDYYYKGGVASSDLSYTGLYLNALRLYDKPRADEKYPIDDSVRKERHMQYR